MPPKLPFLAVGGLCPPASLAGYDDEMCLPLQVTPVVLLRQHEVRPTKPPLLHRTGLQDPASTLLHPLCFLHAAQDKLFPGRGDILLLLVKSHTEGAATG